MIQALSSRAGRTPEESKETASPLKAVKRSGPVHPARTDPAKKRLVVTADDFGAAFEVNEAVEQAHCDGILTAASLMVSGAAAHDAIERARKLPRLGVGLHIALVEGRPVLSPEQVPALVDEQGLFRSDILRMAIEIFASPAARRQVAAEIEAQFAAFAATGLSLDHVNAHKHFHLHPTIAATILRIGRRYGMTALRTPIEPQALLYEIDGTRSSARVETLWARLLRRRIRAAGLSTTDQVFGLAWSGAMTADRARGIIDHLPDGLTELYTHPATAPYPGCASGYDYAGELAGLMDPAVKERIASKRVVLGRFSDFGAPTR